MNWLRELFVENWGLKLASLALAVILWAAMGSDAVTEAVFDVPIEFSNVPGGIELLPQQSRVQLLARGPSRALRGATAADFSVRVDLASATEPGTRTFPLAAEQVQAPSSVTVVQVIPAAVRLALEETTAKQVPVHPQFSREPAGYRVRDFQLQPSQVTIVGPKSRVEAIEYAVTDVVNLALLPGRRSFTTTPTVPDPLVRVEAAVVKVSVEVEQTLPEGQR